MPRQSDAAVAWDGYTAAVVVYETYPCADHEWGVRTTFNAFLTRFLPNDAAGRLCVSDARAATFDRARQGRRP